MQYNVLKPINLMNIHFNSEFCICIMLFEKSFVCSLYRLHETCNNIGAMKQIYICKLNSTLLQNQNFEMTMCLFSFDGISTHTIDTLQHQLLSIMFNALDLEVIVNTLYMDYSFLTGKERKEQECNAMQYICCIQIYLKRLPSYHIHQHTLPSTISRSSV